ncbi:hypothetical protein KCP69_19535 [Salmonella enterica subsp. enterica]|nr:hypothetical protein KCP69_19535 [Salmonella enterica subsp. enterica]
MNLRYKFYLRLMARLLIKCNLHCPQCSRKTVFPFKVMEEDEEELFLKICIKYGEKKSCLLSRIFH